MVWTNDKTYILDCNVGIAPGYTLTIQAGTEVHFNGNYNLNVGGALIADGTAEQPIRFMSHTGGSWGRIFFDDPSRDAQATSEGGIRMEICCATCALRAPRRELGVRTLHRFWIT